MTLLKSPSMDVSLATPLHERTLGIGCRLMQDTFADAAATQGVPRVKVAVLDPQSIPSEIEIVTDSGVLTQRIQVTGLPDQCLRCHGFGHQARACPRFTRADPPSAPRQAALEPPRQSTSPPPAEEGWTEVKKKRKRSKPKGKKSTPQQATPPPVISSQHPGKGKDKGKEKVTLSTSPPLDRKSVV